MPNVSGCWPARLRAATTRASAAAETLRIGDIAVRLAFQRRMQRVGDGDGVAVEAEIERRQDRHAHVAEAQAGGDRQRGQQMRGVELADVEPIAHIRPGHFPHQFDIEAFLGREALVDRDDQGGRIRKRNEPHPQRAHVRCGRGLKWSSSSVSRRSNVLTRLSAMSAIRRPLLMAVWRSRA